jgi:acetate kinase
MKILVLNAGSSSQKSCLYEMAGDDFEQSARLVKTQMLKSLQRRSKHSSS